MTDVLAPEGWSFTGAGMSRDGVHALDDVHIGVADDGEALVLRSADGVRQVAYDAEVRRVSDNWLAELLAASGFLGASGSEVLGILAADLAATATVAAPTAPASVRLTQSLAELYDAYLDQQRTRRGFIDGASFILDVPANPPALWGEGKRVLWTNGEGLLITGPQGVGKTTLAQQLVLHLIGVRDDDFLGLPVEQRDDVRVLYLALDRPAQVARSFRRMVGAKDAALLEERLIVWSGPLPFNVAQTPKKLAAWAREQGANVIVVDSYKDLAPDLSKEEAGANINTAMQECLAEGIEWIGLHHNRKANSENRHPKSLADVYGSNWLTAGVGSILSVYGNAGETVVEANHIKQPAEPVGPLTISHDHGAGVSGALTVDGDISTNANQRARRAAIRDAIGTGEELTTAQIRQRIDYAKSERTLKADLAALIEGGYLTSESQSGKPTLYSVPGSST
jgi:hypothetical protein